MYWDVKGVLSLVDGYRDILGIVEGDKEDKAGWSISARFEKTAMNFGGMIKMAFIQRYLKLASI